ncbi:MAG: sulfite exporter TauE/SafE family protein [Neisseriaceae bacterium]|nr:TSUP family transporter [Neisseriaceae bacterium PsAf]MCV2502506.1 sulfite exporter TauE/SafE family protein [Neisseriaceae bacterium]MCV2509082.1 sulfite exporter TauE/SafE family protein [Neisseriaceae bacterium]
MDLQHFLLIIPIASIAGFLSGLLGIGGGLLTIPIIVYMLRSNFGDIEYLQQMAIGTSFAVMVLTVISSAMAHNRNGNVNWNIVKKMVIPIILGTALGALISPYIPSDYLQVLFILFVYYIAIKSIINLEDKNPVVRELTTPKIKSVGFGTGLLSSWVGVGGGSIFVPFFLRYNIDIKKSLGTSAALGFPVALVGVIMYIVAGLKHVSSLPEHSIGFVYWPYFIGLAICTMIFAPLGAKVSAISNPKLLKVFFVLLLITIGTKMLWDLIH